jgi:glycosyltransferase involved in cell wall biosynthesis
MKNLRTEDEIIAPWEGIDETPLVSVVCATFNQEKYISDAINSFLNQETNFPFEVIIHDDCSTDGTRKVIDEYVENYPRIIKPVYQTENQFSKGKRPINLASKYTKGKFIALCEGDDYWLSASKLQKQADFLMNNADCSAITHQTIKIFEDGRSKPQVFTKIEKDHWELDDLIFGRQYHTASLMFRSDILRNNEIPDNIVAGDKAISFLLLSRGKIKYLPEAMAVYRKNSGGISSWVTADIMAKDLNLLPWLKRIDPAFPIKKYQSIIHSTICSYPSSIRLTVALHHYFLFFIYSFSYFPKNLKSIAGLGKSLLARALKGGFISGL